MSAELAAVFVLGAGIYLLVTALPFAEPGPSWDERLRQFDVDARVAERRSAAMNSRPLVPWAAVNTMVQPLLEDLASPVRRALGGEGVYGAELERQLGLVRPGADPRWFAALQVLLGGAAALAIVALSLAIGAPTSLALGLSVVSGVVAFMAPQIWLRAASGRRRQNIIAELPALCRLLSLALDVGMSLDRALLVVARRSAGPLGHALQAASEEVVGDRRLKDALADLSKREGVPELDSFITLLLVSEREGLELIPSLESMAMSLNERRAARTIEAAEKGSIKMLAPVAFVMFPVALAVALAPLLATVLSLVGHSS